MTIHHALHSISNIESLYLTNKISGHGLLQVKPTVENEIIYLNEYINEGLLINVWKKKYLNVTESTME